MSPTHLSSPTRLVFSTAGLGLLLALAQTTPAATCPCAVTEPTSQLVIAALFDRSISTGFGQKIHPVLQFVRLHTGGDYATPIGEPIKAAATGVVTMAEFQGDYGNCISLDHGAGWETTYSHLSRFVVGLVPGTCIDAAAVIGFTGTTGLSAGPNLHFEVTRHGVWLDPAVLLSR